MPKTIRIKRILSHEEAQKEAKETCPHGMSYFLLSCHQCDKYDYCNLLWEFGEADKRISYEYYSWCRQWCKELFRITKEASPILLFSSRRYLHRVCCALEDEGFLIRDILIWQKR